MERQAWAAGSEDFREEPRPLSVSAHHVPGRTGTGWTLDVTPLSRTQGAEAVRGGGPLVG